MDICTSFFYQTEIPTIILSVQTHIIMTDVLYLHEKPLLSFTGNVTGKVRDNVVVNREGASWCWGFGQIMKT